MRWPWQVEQKDAGLTALELLVAEAKGNIAGVDPSNCMQSPTVHAIVTAISRRIAVTPVHIYKTTIKDGIESKERISNHPVNKVLNRPNSYQTRYDYWQDAASTLLRYGRYYALKMQGKSGPLMGLDPLLPSHMELKREDGSFKLKFKYNQQDIPAEKIHMVRGPARDFINGDSPVKDVAVAIALEIAAERYGAQFFQNGAIPLIIFKYLQGTKGFKTPEEEKNFISRFQEMFSGDKRHRAMMLPVGMETGQITIENDKAQMLETRKYQRTVIAGAFGVPPNFVGDLDRATWNNVEQMDKDFTSNVIMPYTDSFAASMERDLLTEKEYDDGLRIRFNLDSILRADFKSRQEGLQIQRINGVINANEWREHEKMNPIGKQDGGDQYYRSANYMPIGELDGQSIEQDQATDQVTQ